MNQNLKVRHFTDITDENAQNIYEVLCAACEKREGGMTDADQMLVADIARQEQTKQLYLADIRKRGIGENRYNGRQTYYQENKSVPGMRACCEQQRRTLAELKLTPSTRKAAPAEVDDEFTAF